MGDQAALERPDTGSERRVVRSALEFAFGKKPHTYFASSFPYRPIFAENDERIYQCSEDFVPSIQKKIKDLKPRYILNVAINDKGGWFMYYHSPQAGPGRAWSNERPPTVNDGVLGRRLDRIRDKLTQLNFGPLVGDQHTFFFRGVEETDCELEWYPGYDALPEECETAIQEQWVGGRWKKGCPRFITFGADGGWIICYKMGWYEWSEYLPPALDARLKEGRDKKWTINEAVLNPWNYYEYVLVFDQGPVFCCFHSNFLPKFRLVTDEWRDGQRRVGNNVDLYEGPQHVAVERLPARQPDSVTIETSRPGSVYHSDPNLVGSHSPPGPTRNEPLQGRIEHPAYVGSSPPRNPPLPRPQAPTTNRAHSSIISTLPQYYGTGSTNSGTLYDPVAVSHGAALNNGSPRRGPTRSQPSRGTWATRLFHGDRNDRDDRHDRTGPGRTGGMV